MDSESEDEDDIIEIATKQTNAFVKWRKLNSADEIEGELRPVEQYMYRQRKWEGRPPYYMLEDPRTQDPSDRKGGTLFRLRFRVPYPLFERLTEMTRMNNQFSEGNDCALNKAAPSELKI